MPAKDDKTTADKAFSALVRAADAWAYHHMDQWEKFKFETDYGPIYVSLSMHDPYPDSFDLVDRETGKVVKQAGQ